MKTIENRKENATAVILDDCYFVNCEFDACVLIYNGGDYGWNNTTFRNCMIHFQGPAARALTLLRYFNALPEKALGQVSSKSLDTTKEWVQ